MWDVRSFGMLAGMWVRVSWAYRTSFVLMLGASLLLTGVDFAAIVVVFSNVDRIGGFGLHEIAFLSGATTLGLGMGDLVVGNVERLGTRIRLCTFDAMLVRPVGVLVQMCADESRCDVSAGCSRAPSSSPGR